MAFSLGTIQTAFATYLTAVATTATAKAAVVALGPFPLFPLQITGNSDYTTVATAQATWLSSYATNSATYQAALASQRVAELAVINTIISVTTSATTPKYGANEWYKHTDDHWFAYSDTATNPVDGQFYLVVTTTLPTKSFLNSTS